MIAFFELALSGFWPFVGVLLILGVAGTLLRAIVQVSVHGVCILARGWPQKNEPPAWAQKRAAEILSQLGKRPS